MKDCKDEVPGCLRNDPIASTLAALNPSTAIDHFSVNMLHCYQPLIEPGLVDASELQQMQVRLDNLAALPSGLP